MKQEIKTLEWEIRLARIVVGTLLGMLVGAAMLIGNAIAAKPAAAQGLQPAWQERAAIVEQLASQYAEKPAELGVTSEGAVLELFMSDDGATWTLVVTLPNGMSRVIGAGEGWFGRQQLAKGRVS